MIFFMVVYVFCTLFFCVVSIVIFDNVCVYFRIFPIVILSKSLFTFAFIAILMYLLKHPVCINHSASLYIRYTVYIAFNTDISKLILYCHVFVVCLLIILVIYINIWDTISYYSGVYRGVMDKKILACIGYRDTLFSKAYIISVIQDSI